MSATLITIVLVPLALIFILLVFVTLNRYITYKERRAMAELGVSWDDLRKDQLERRRGNHGVLWGGVITTMSGLALLLGLLTLGTGAWLLAGLLPLFVGIGMVLIYFMTLGPEEARQGEQDIDVPLDEVEPSQGSDSH